jgi:hypothetical protein
MKIIFLDIDGILNVFSNYSKDHNFSRSACNNLNDLLSKEPDLKIVISSAWRRHGILFVQNLFRKNSLPYDKIIDITEFDNKSEASIDRGVYIKRWMDKHPEVTKFVIFDDESNMGELMNKLVKINSWIGITSKDVKKAIEILNK